MYNDLALVKQHNDQAFIKDLKRVREVMVLCSAGFLCVKKSEVWQAAKEKKIQYIITNEVFIQKRDTMVLL